MIIIIIAVQNTRTVSQIIHEKDKSQSWMPRGIFVYSQKLNVTEGRSFPLKFSDKNFPKYREEKNNSVQFVFLLFLWRLELD